jgi:hypothetical protein
MHRRCTWNATVELYFHVDGEGVEHECICGPDPEDAINFSVTAGSWSPRVNTKPRTYRT